MAFTLVEILVAIAIIAVLVGILIPAIMMGRSVAEQAATRQTLQGIASALAVYERDHDGYPPSTKPAGGSLFGLNVGSPMNNWKGAELVCQALTGASPDDGEADFGWKKGGSGRTFGPYYEPAQYDLQKRNGGFAFNDRWDKHVRYYKAIPGQDDVWGANNARFDTGHNEDSDEIHVDKMLDNGEIERPALRAAKFMLASPGPTDEPNDADDHDDVIVLGP